MKTYISFAKKVKKGMTLIELVIAMALASIVLAGAGTILFSMNKMSDNQVKQYTYVADAKNLAYAIDTVFKKDEIKNIKVVDGKNLGKDGCSDLFIIDDVKYGLNKNIFGKVSDKNISSENRIYQAKYDMFVNIDVIEENNVAEFTIYYGESYSGSLILVERI